MLDVCIKLYYIIYMKRFVYIFCSLCVIFSTVFYTSAGEWDWTDGFFDVDENFQGEDYVPTSQVIESEKSYKIILEENSPSLVRSSSPSANYTLSPSDIPFYLLEQQGFTEVYEIMKRLFSGSEEVYTCLLSVGSNNLATLYICERGVPFTYETYSNGGYNVNRFAYGSIYLASETFTPKFFVVRYNKSDNMFYDRLNAEMSVSTNGVDFGSSLVTDPYYHCFSIFSNNLTNFISNVRDLYFFGYPQTALSTTVKPGQTINASYYLTRGDNTKIFRTSLYGAYTCGNSRDYFPSLSVLPDSGTRSYFYNSQYTINDFLVYDIEEYEGDFSAIDQALIQFTNDTNDFVSRINQSKSRVTGYISDFFNVFDSDHIPRPLYFIILFLVICAVLVGVFS